MQRGDLRTFQTTFRGGANLLAPQSPPNRSTTSGSRISSFTDSVARQAELLPDAPPDVGAGGGRSLDDVWKKSMFSQAEGLDTIDRAALMRPDADGNIAVLRMEPDRFYMGRVLRPTVTVETIPVAALHDDGARLMHPKERRAIHDAEVNSRQANLALREAFKARTKLANNCAINYPHGVLGCSETPYAASGLESAVYGQKSRELLAEEVRSQRKGKAGGAAHVAPVAAVGLDIGTSDRPRRTTGRSHSNVPRDTLKLNQEY